MLFITHDLALASDLCDRIAVVYAGQVRELGPAEDVLGDAARPVHAAAAREHPAAARRREAPAFLAGAPPDLRDAADRLPLRGALPGGVRALRASRRRSSEVGAGSSRPLLARAMPAWPSVGRGRARRSRRMTVTSDRCRSRWSDVRASRSMSRRGVLRVARRCAPCGT